MTSHVGLYKGEEVACIHSDYGYLLIIFKDHWVFSKKCLIPTVPVTILPLRQ
jgi:hypothetical protein